MAEWITVFAASQTPSVFGGGKNHTTRVIIPINIGGNALRLCFANNGAEKGSIAHVTVAKCDKEGNLLDSTCMQVLFQGKRGTELEAESETVSDRIEMNISVGEFLAVSIYCDKAPQSAAGRYARIDGSWHQ